MAKPSEAYSLRDADVESGHAIESYKPAGDTNKGPPGHSASLDVDPQKKTGLLQEEALTPVPYLSLFK
jgi:hypothetical protein